MPEANEQGGPPADPRPASATFDPRGAGVGRSNLQELAALLPELARLVPALLSDTRVPLRTKLAAGAALAYVTVPVDPLPELVPGTGFGADDVLVLVWAIRHLIAGAGYEVVRERWTGSEAGFAFLLLVAGVAA